MPKRSVVSSVLETKWLTPEDFELLCFNLTQAFLSFQEPIPAYITRDNNLLESSLGQPMQTFGGKLLYPTLAKLGFLHHR